MCAGTFFTSGLIGRGCSVPPPRPDCALALVEMPGRPRCPERIPGSLGLGRAGKLIWGSGLLGAVGEETEWCGSAPSGSRWLPGSQGVRGSRGVGGGGARLMSGARR